MGRGWELMDVPVLAAISSGGFSYGGFALRIFGGIARSNRDELVSSRAISF